MAWTPSLEPSSKASQDALAGSLTRNQELGLTHIAQYGMQDSQGVTKSFSSSVIAQWKYTDSKNFIFFLSVLPLIDCFHKHLSSLSFLWCAAKLFLYGSRLHILLNSHKWNGLVSGLAMWAYWIVFGIRLFSFTSDIFVLKNNFFSTLFSHWFGQNAESTRIINPQTLLS